MVLLCISCVMWIRLSTPFLHLLCNVYNIDNSLKTSSNFYLNIILGTQDFMSCFEWIDIYLLNSFKIFERKFIWSTICTMRCSIGYKGFKYSNYLGCFLTIECLIVIHAGYDGSDIAHFFPQLSLLSKPVWIIKNTTFFYIHIFL